MTTTIELRASYHLTDDGLHAELELSGNLGETLEEDAEDSDAVVLTILHERLTTAIEAADCFEVFTHRLALADGECVILIARQHGEIIGSLINEVTWNGDLLLHPKGGFGLVVHQRYNEHPNTTSLQSGTLARTLESLAGQQFSPATAALTQLLTATEQHYAVAARPMPRTLQLLWPPLLEALVANDEKYARQSIGYLCNTLESLGAHAAPDLAQIYAQVEARRG